MATNRKEQQKVLSRWTKEYAITALIAWHAFNCMIEGNKESWYECENCQAMNHYGA